MATQPITRRLLLGHGLGAALLPGAAAAAGHRPEILQAGRPVSGAAPASSGLTSRPPPGRGRPPVVAGARPPAPLLVLDPGHGGKDPGAIGVSGTFEKHVAFATAEELKRQIEAQGRFRVQLTRGRDVFIPLEERVGVAQAHGAALFVSMHADAIADHRIRGASIYTLSDVASDAQTAALAQRENSADRFAPPSLHVADPQVAAILGNLVRRETRAGSVHLQRSLVSSLGQDLPMLDNPARHARFVVLKASDIPSVLVEMGFMSNPVDEAALRQAVHRARVAAAMHRALEAWLAASAFASV